MAENPDPQDFAAQVVGDSSPEATVTVNYVSLEEDYWTAVWQKADQHQGFDGSRSAVMQWAASQSADHYFIFDLLTNDFVPFLPDETVEE